MASDAPTIATEASCFTCQGEKALLGMQVYLLSQLWKANAPMADIDPAVIAQQSNCYTCYMSGKGLLGASVYLLNQILQGGGGGIPITVNEIYTGAAPPAAPAFPLQGAIFTPDADGQPLQKWIPGTGWVVILFALCFALLHEHCQAATYLLLSQTNNFAKGITNEAKAYTDAHSGGGIVGTVSNNVASAGLLAVDSTKTNGIAATKAHITNAWNIFDGDTAKFVNGAGALSAPAGGGNVINSGASVVGMIPVYTDTSGTAVTPTNEIPIVRLTNLTITTFPSAPAVLHNYAASGSDGHNIFLGESAGNFTMGPAGGASSLGSQNIGMGYQALLSNTKGENNTAIGAGALKSNTEGNNNVALGAYALFNNTTPSQNVAVGEMSQYANQTGHANSSVGYDSLPAILQGSGECALGDGSLLGLQYGDYTIGIGTYSGSYVDTGFTLLTNAPRSIYIGYRSMGTQNATNEIVIGEYAQGLGTNTVVLGNDNIVTTALKGNVLLRSTTTTNVLLGVGITTNIVPANAAMLTNSWGIFDGDTSKFLRADGTMQAPPGGGSMAGTVSNNVASAGLLAVDSTKTNGIAATFAHVTNSLGYQPSKQPVKHVRASTVTVGGNGVLAGVGELLAISASGQAVQAPTATTMYGVKLTTTVSSNNVAMISGNGYFHFYPGKSTYFAARAAISATNAVRSYIGLSANYGANMQGTSTAYPVYHYAVFRFSSELSDTWYFVTCDGATVNAVDTGVKGDSNPHLFEMVEGPTGTWTPYIDGVAHTASSANAPAAAMSSYFAIAPLNVDLDAKDFYFYETRTESTY